jgi:hypothetical protein
MAALLRLPAGLFALVFLGVGLTWWIAPGYVSDQFRMELLTGAALSTQIADLASFFLTLGGLILSGLITGNRAWLCAAIALLAVALFGRAIAWMFHGADLALDMMAVEGLVIAVLSLNLWHMAPGALIESKAPKAR